MLCVCESSNYAWLFMLPNYTYMRERIWHLVRHGWIVGPILLALAVFSDQVLGWAHQPPPDYPFLRPDTTSTTHTEQSEHAPSPTGEHESAAASAGPHSHRPEH